MKPHPLLSAVDMWQPVEFRGSVIGITNGLIEANGPTCSVGDYCEVEAGDGQLLLAEVISVSEARIGLSPMHGLSDLKLGATVRQSARHRGIGVSDDFADRAINALGHPIDGGPKIQPDKMHPRAGVAPDTLDRHVRSDRLVTGVRAIDGLFPLAIGQRIGIFAASGVGKTSLMDQLARQVEADHCILCLVGERGREAERLWSMHGAEKAGARFTLVAATSDESASLRVRAVEQSLALAEYWRDKGRDVVLFVDSVTRFALALREIGLAAGEPPTIRAFTPNVFATLPRIVERCGASKNSGSITAIFTVLSENDDQDDPFVELMKSLLDGHIILSRHQAERGVFPAIEVSASISRLASDLFDKGQAQLAQSAHSIHADYNDARSMIESGLYKKGSSTKIDNAIAAYPRLIEFLRQPMDLNSELSQTYDKLSAALRDVAA